eukprot:gene38514-biopygen22152
MGATAMDVKEAIVKAKTSLLDLLQDEDPTNLGLEEVRYDDDAHRWRITLGFSRPWSANALSSLTGRDTGRTYKVIEIDGLTGAFKGMTNRDVA